MSFFVTSELDRKVQDASRLHGAGRPAEAEALLRDIMSSDPVHLVALTKLAEIEVERRDPAAALAHLRIVLDREPNFAPALSHLSHALWLSGRMHEGLEPARRAVEIQPSNPLLRLNLGQHHAWLNQQAEAEAAVQPLLEADWHPPLIRARAWGVVGEARMRRGEFESAHEAMETAIRLALDFDELHMVYGISLLRLGRLEEGWVSYGRRDRIPFFYPTRTAGLPGLRWRGEPLDGKVILLKDDQGYGDAIQFFRYLRQLRSLSPARIVLSTFTPLQSLFAASTDVADVVTDLPPGWSPDFYCLTADLPGVFRTSLGTIPAASSYLRVPPDAVGRMPRLSKSRTRQVGLVWSGDTRHLNDHLRSIPAADFLRITDVPGIRFHSLLNAVRPSDLDALKAASHVGRNGERFESYADTAAIVSQLDLVITVDTSVAHLAGALRIPVWLLLPIVPDWRWLIGREDSPWYPSMRLFRGGLDGWNPVLARVADALRNWVGDLRTVAARPLTSPGRERAGRR